MTRALLFGRAFGETIAMPRARARQRNCPKHEFEAGFKNPLLLGL
jgi:hypothetical protein